MSKFKVSFKVDAGSAHALILKQNGELYGIGENDFGRSIYSFTSQIHEPILLTRGVKAFAAGCDYSIYVTESGSVKLIGNGKYTERFAGFERAQDVAAWSDKNVFFIEDNMDRWYCFGDNSDGKIAGFKRETLYQFPEKTYVGDPFKIMAANVGSGPNVALLSRGGTDAYNNDLDDKVNASLMRSDTYRRLSAEYGEENLVVEVNKIGKEDYNCHTHSDSFTLEWKSKYAPRIMRKNFSIYKPLECNHNSMVSLEKCTDISDMQYVEKTVAVGANTFILRNNGELSVLKHDNKKETVILDEVFDMSMTDNVVIISKMNGEILFGMKAQASEFYREYGIKHLQTFTM